MSDNVHQVISDGGALIIFDSTKVSADDVASLFTKRPSGGSTAIGRTEAIFFEHEGRAMVLKHYRRGGAMAKISKERYFGFLFSTSRAVREYKLLDRLQKLGLPSPVPVAARVERRGVFYKASLITERIMPAETLADLCYPEFDRDIPWSAVGACIRRFHDAGVCHSDLNARNVLIDEADRVYLIDFDKGCLRLRTQGWKDGNLARLLRSLRKFKAIVKGIRFHPKDWKILLEGYAGND